MGFRILSHQAKSLLFPGSGLLMLHQSQLGTARPASLALVSWAGLRGFPVLSHLSGECFCSLLIIEGFISVVVQQAFSGKLEVGVYGHCLET